MFTKTKTRKIVNWKTYGTHIPVPKQSISQANPDQDIYKLNKESSQLTNKLFKFKHDPQFKELKSKQMDEGVQLSSIKINDKQVNTRNQLRKKDYYSISPDKKNQLSTIDTTTQKKNHFSTTSSTNFSVEMTNTISNLGKKVQSGLR